MNADTLAERALDAAERATDPEVVRVCDYIAAQALYGNRTDNDIAALATTLNIHTRSKGAIQAC